MAFHRPTRYLWSKTSRCWANLCPGHTLDLIIFQQTCTPSDVAVDQLILSDHGLITCYFLLSRPPQPALHTKIMRRLNTVDVEALISLIRQSAVCTNIAQVADCSISDQCALY